MKPCQKHKIKCQKCDFITYPLSLSSKDYWNCLIYAYPKSVLNKDSELCDRWIDKDDRY